MRYLKSISNFVMEVRRSQKHCTHTLLSTSLPGHILKERKKIKKKHYTWLKREIDNPKRRHFI